MFIVTYAGKNYDWDKLEQRLDPKLIAHISKQYGGQISRQRLLEEYIALAGWWFTLRGVHEAKEPVFTKGE